MRNCEKKVARWLNELCPVDKSWDIVCFFLPENEVLECFTGRRFLTTTDKSNVNTVTHGII